MNPNPPLTIQEPNAAAAASTSDLEFNNFLSAHPRPKDQVKTRKLFNAAIASGVVVADLLKAAQIYAEQQKGQPHRYKAGSDTWLEKRGYEDALRGAPNSSTVDHADAAKITERWVKAIKTGHQALARHCSAGTARELIAQELVTTTQCREMGIQI